MAAMMLAAACLLVAVLAETNWPDRLPGVAMRGALHEQKTVAAETGAVMFSGRLLGRF